MVKEKIRAQILGGSMQDFKRHLSGTYRGFHIVIDLGQAQGQYMVTINASSSSDPENAQWNDFLLRQKEHIKKIVKVAVYSYCAVLTVQIPNLAKNIPDTINGIVEPNIDYLLNGGYTSGCEHCGTADEPLECYEINGGHHYICGSCPAEIQTQMRMRQQDIQSQKSHLIPGLVGAFVGSLIGCLLWIGIYKLGYIAGIAGLVTGVCAMKGYELLGGCLDKKGVLGSVIIMIFTIFMANKLAWTWDAYSVYKDYGATFSDVYRSLRYIIVDSELMGSYIGDLVIGYILTFVASFRSIRNALRASTGSYTIKKIK